ncbi:hypothetical protein EMIHUDRAFT_234400 [Emiliania huxleyi CCMP1516]|uniref:Uncharacterized protein n=2 Tax=Emiliania huxleyi TaxID=2903 RepID=A0A0D3JZE9_EMIH1|nr:hypothetical protein EMIHUDRAFT_234400 [Emiliania huxleyi CCMP1516]EOD28884.1 hypothetical protein EMIHUDRAFT_234400 [Emiliania huxleyi CCMP1516]|eukprot:XP_005781313.1 hypothetical protein EMIHUDRAFT_234400 [Emiliania huxleyi CCMP1516]
MAVGALRLLAGDAAVILAVDRSATRRALLAPFLRDWLSAGDTGPRPRPCGGGAAQAGPLPAACGKLLTVSGLGMDKKFISTSSVVTSYTQASGTAEGLAASFALLAAGAGLRAPLSIAR